MRHRTCTCTVTGCFTTKGVAASSLLSSRSYRWLSMLGPSSGTPGLGLPMKRRILRTGRTGARIGADCGRPLVGAAALIGRGSFGLAALTGWARPPVAVSGLRAEPGLIDGTIVC
eukprot:scaffold57511_cov68-Phaeocystis_antarctica.AAC.1